MLPNGSLQILKTSVSDSGTYMCVAQNPAGTALAKIKLKVQGGWLVILALNLIKHFTYNKYPLNLDPCVMILSVYLGFVFAVFLKSLQ